MIFIGFYQQTKPRRTSEERWSRLNVLIFACHLAAYAYALMLLLELIKGSTSSAFGAATWSVTEETKNIDIWCSGNRTTPMSRFGQRYGVYIDADYATVLWNRCIGSLIEAIVYNGVLLGLSLFSKIWFEWGRQVIRIRSITIHQNILLTAQLLCAILALISMSNAHTQGEILRRWMSGCDQGGRENAMNATPNIPLYAAVCIDLFFQVLAFAMYCYYGSRSCRLDYDILEVGADGSEVISKRPATFAINNVPHRRDRKYIEAYKAQLLRDEELEEITMDPNVISELEASDYRRLRQNITAAASNNQINTNATSTHPIRPMHLGTFQTTVLPTNASEGNTSQLPTRRYQNRIPRK